VLQHHIKALDGVLAAMATATDIVGELDDADKSSEHDQYLNRRYRRAEVYEVLDGLLTTAIQKEQQVEKQLADFLEAPPKLAKRLALWQAKDAKNYPACLQPNSSPGQKPGLFFVLMAGVAASSLARAA
jgi:hypothetical protein